MTHIKNCIVCKSQRIVSGKLISSTDGEKVTFVPNQIKFVWTLTTPCIDIASSICLDCGFVCLVGDIDEARYKIKKFGKEELLAKLQSSTDMQRTLESNTQSLQRQLQNLNIQSVTSEEIQVLHEKIHNLNIDLNSLKNEYKFLETILEEKNNDDE